MWIRILDHDNPSIFFDYKRDPLDPLFLCQFNISPDKMKEYFMVIKVWDETTHIETAIKELSGKKIQANLFSASDVLLRSAVVKNISYALTEYQGETVERLSMDVDQYL